MGSAANTQLFIVARGGKFLREFSKAARSGSGENGGATGLASRRPPRRTTHNFHERVMEIYAKGYFFLGGYFSSDFLTMSSSFP